MNPDHISAADYGARIEPLLPQAMAYALSILMHRGDAEDAVQQAALHGLERLNSYQRARPFKGWWFVVLRNCCVDCLRKRSALHLKSHDVSQLAASAIDATAVSDALASALEKISSEHSEILRLRYYGGLSYREIAQSLDIPDGTVMSRLHLARKALAALIRVEDL